MNCTECGIETVYVNGRCEEHQEWGKPIYYDLQEELDDIPSRLERIEAKLDHLEEKIGILRHELQQ